jgi:lysophospholipase L1-like esterase
MRAKLRHLAANLGLLAASLLASLLFAEFVIFGIFFKPDDVLANVSRNGVVRYQPNTRATFRHPDGRETRVSINAQGWNSSKPDYSQAPAAGRLRIAVIGDSYVHASFVNVEAGFPEVIERELKSAGVAAEVFRFGMDGAPLSQYLNVLRREVRALKPDVVLVQLIHNDFDESYRFLKTRYASSFLKLGFAAAGEPFEIAPADFRPGLADRLRAFNTFRYLYYKTNAYLRLKRLVSRYWWGGEEEYAPEFISSAVDVRKITDHVSNRRAARYVLSEMRRLAKENGFKLVLAMDGVRDAIYSGKALESYEVAKLNRLTAEVAAELEIPFLDLHTTFAAHYARNQQRFEFAYDWHWNELANQLVGAEIARFLRRHRDLSLTRAAGTRQPQG